MHGKASCGKPEHVRYLAGCKLLVSVTKGIQVREVHSGVLPFKWLLQTARMYDRSGEPFEDLDKHQKRRRSFTDFDYSAF
jgi:hypothetical protein